jgi:hypothetical protein
VWNVPWENIAQKSANPPSQHAKTVEMENTIREQVALQVRHVCRVNPANFIGKRVYQIPKNVINVRKDRFA